MMSKIALSVDSTILLLIFPLPPIPISGKFNIGMRRIVGALLILNLAGLWSSLVAG